MAVNDIARHGMHWATWLAVVLSVLRTRLALVIDAAQHKASTWVLVLPCDSCSGVFMLLLLFWISHHKHIMHPTCIPFAAAKQISSHSAPSASQAALTSMSCTAQFTHKTWYTNAKGLLLCSHSPLPAAPAPVAALQLAVSVRSALGMHHAAAPAFPLEHLPGLLYDPQQLPSGLAGPAGPRRAFAPARTARRHAKKSAQSG